MRCPECGAHGHLQVTAVEICSHCLNSGRQFAIERPIGELARLLQLSRMLRERSLQTRLDDTSRVERRGGPLVAGNPAESGSRFSELKVPGRS